MIDCDLSNWISSKILQNSSRAKIKILHKQENRLLIGQNFGLLVDDCFEDLPSKVSKWHSFKVLVVEIKTKLNCAKALLHKSKSFSKWQSFSKIYGELFRRSFLNIIYFRLSFWCKVRDSWVVYMSCRLGNVICRRFPMFNYRSSCQTQGCF